MRGEPLLDVAHHGLLAGVVQEIVEVAVIELQGLILGAGVIVEFLAALPLGGVVVPAVQDENRQRDFREFFLQPIVGNRQRGDRAWWPALRWR